MLSRTKTTGVGVVNVQLKNHFGNYSEKQFYRVIVRFQSVFRDNAARDDLHTQIFLHRLDLTIPAYRYTSNFPSLFVPMYNEEVTY